MLSYLRVRQIKFRLSATHTTCVSGRTNSIDGPNRHFCFHMDTMYYNLFIVLQVISVFHVVISPLSTLLTMIALLFFSVFCCCSVGVGATALAPHCQYPTNITTYSRSILTFKELVNTGPVDSPKTERTPLGKV